MLNKGRVVEAKLLLDILMKQEQYSQLTNSNPSSQDPYPENTTSQCDCVTTWKEHLQK